MSAFAPLALGSGRACHIRFYDEIDKSINKLKIVQTVPNVQNWWRTDEKLMRSDEELMKNWWRTDDELMKDG